MTQHTESGDEADGAALRDLAAAELLAARDRTTLLTSAVDEADLIKQHSPLMSPLVWDLAHIANQEELWLLRGVGGRDPIHPEIDPLYDAFEHPRAERPTLPLLTPAEARRYGHEVRGRVLDLMEKVTLPGDAAGGFGSDIAGPGSAFAFGMVAQHEVQHDETMLATHQLRTGPAALTAPTAPGRARRRGPAARRGVRARRGVHHGHLGRAVGAGQRAARAPGARARLLAGHDAGHQRGLRGVHRRRGLRRPPAVDASRGGRTGSGPG